MSLRPQAFGADTSNSSMSNGNHVLTDASEGSASDEAQPLKVRTGNGRDPFFLLVDTLPKMNSKTLLRDFERFLLF
jgi:hypothetical protein